MAGADYYSCDVCGNKTVYDADIYDRWEDPRVGAMIIICSKCSETHEVVIHEKVTPNI